ncbi:hypothetical protein [Mesorhizobium sp.]|uniref:hypothetical protein n=1 Tax=Mesorhizobium sp. TaxID=1871066 RepID=UPI0025DF6A68|nr:hypothetical protein [Mesorhizobium sp.]
MRQHLLNGWLVAALVATTCLLGVTAYAEVKEDISRGACAHGEQLPASRAHGVIAVAPRDAMSAHQEPERQPSGDGMSGNPPAKTARAFGQRYAQPR